MEFHTNFKHNLEQINKIIDDTCASCGRSPQEIELIAVSKTQPVEAIMALHALGITCFGESYAQELQSKASTAQGQPLSWSFIGHLQSNKISKIVQYAGEIQALASLKHAALIERHAIALQKAPFPVYLAVNSADSSQKSGVSIDEIVGFYEQVKTRHPQLKVRGIMTVPPDDIEDPEPSEPLMVPDLYLKLKELSLKVGEGKLSLGMSSDMRTAIAAGSTCIRIGTALFGKRNYPKSFSE
jgi:pyridoxal phosphate enzyme (YggS family)